MCGEGKNAVWQSFCCVVIVQLSEQSETFAISCGVYYQIEENMIHKNMYHSV
jgi:hypothetical protein